jgi:hypothetical protein
LNLLRRRTDLCVALSTGNGQFFADVTSRRNGDYVGVDINGRDFIDELNRR